MQIRKLRLEELFRVTDEGTGRQLGMGQLATELLSSVSLGAYYSIHTHLCLPSPYCLRLSLESGHEEETPKARGSCPDLAGQALR